MSFGFFMVQKVFSGYPDAGIPAYQINDVDIAPEQIRPGYMLVSNGEGVNTNAEEFWRKYNLSIIVVKRKLELLSSGYTDSYVDSILTRIRTDYYKEYFDVIIMSRNNERESITPPAYAESHNMYKYLIDSTNAHSIRKAIGYGSFKRIGGIQDISFTEDYEGVVKNTQSFAQYAAVQQTETISDLLIEFDTNISNIVNNGEQGITEIINYP